MCVRTNSKTRRAVDLLSAASLAILAAPFLAHGGDWTQYANTRYITSLIRSGDSLLVGTKGGAFGYTGPNAMAGVLNSASIGLPRADIKCMAADSNGNVWAVAGYSLVRMDRDSCMVVRGADLGLSSLSVNVVAAGPRGEVWFGGTSGEVGAFDGVRWELRRPETPSPGEHVMALAFDTAGSGWIGTGGRGVYLWDGAAWAGLDTAKTGKEIVVLAPSRNGGIWILSKDKGVVRYDGTAYRSVAAFDGGLPCSSGSLAEDDAGIVWIGTVLPYAFSKTSRSWTLDNGRLYRCDPVTGETKTYSATKGGLTWNGVSALFPVDREHVIVGTTGGGLCMLYQGQTWQAVTTSDTGFAGDCALSIAQGPGGVVAVGAGTLSTSSFIPTTADITGGVTEFFPGGKPWNALGDMTVTALTYAQDGLLWFAGSAAKAWYVGLHGIGGWGLLDTTVTPIRHRLRALCSDSMGGVWAGDEAGLYRHDATTWQTFKAGYGGLPAAGITRLVCAPGNVLWVGTSKGLVRYAGGQWSVYDTTNCAMAEDSVTALALDGSGNPWFASSGSSTCSPNTSLLRYDGNAFVAVDPNSSYISKRYVDGMAFDAGGRLWLAARKALTDVWCSFGTGSSDILEFYGGRWVSYDSLGGRFPGDLAYHRINDVAVDRTGTKWFCSTHGAFTYTGAGVLGVGGRRGAGVPHSVTFGVRPGANGDRVFTVDVRGAVAAQMRLRLYDARGAVVHEIPERWYAPGLHPIRLTRTALAAGTYYCRATLRRALSESEWVAQVVRLP